MYTLYVSINMNKRQLKDIIGENCMYRCCNDDHQKTIKPFFAKIYVNLGM